MTLADHRRVSKIVFKQNGLLIRKIEQKKYKTNFASVFLLLHIIFNTHSQLVGSIYQTKFPRYAHKRFLLLLLFQLANVANILFNHHRKK